MAMSNLCIVSTARMIVGDVVYGERMTRRRRHRVTHRLD